MVDATHGSSLSQLKALPDPGGLRTASFKALVELVSRGASTEALLGPSNPLAGETFEKSLIGTSFPSFWMEAPLLGDAGFDLHVYYDRNQVASGERFEDGCGFGLQALFDWYFGAEKSGVGVGFAHDLRDGSGAVGAYVNFKAKPLSDTRGFFAALGAEDSYGSASDLLGRLPSAWNPWYLGLFPERPQAGVRVGAFVSPKRQAEYAADPRALENDLMQAGFTAFDNAMLERIAQLAATPFTLELQLDATAAGTGDTLGVDLTLRSPSAGKARELFAEDGLGSKACALLESWGAADQRWKHIEQTIFSRLVPLGEGQFIAFGCAPAFIKAKWTAAKPLPAKVYLHCMARLLGA